MTNRLKVPNVPSIVAPIEPNEVPNEADVNKDAHVPATIGVGEKLPAVGVDTVETKDKLAEEVVAHGKPGNEAPCKTEIPCRLATVVANGPVSGGGREPVTSRDTCTVSENVAPG